jgi:hypothetical protein
MDWPTSPAIGTVVSDGARSWTWDGQRWALVLNAGQIVSVFVVVGPLVELAIAALPYPIAMGWQGITYV